MIFLKISSSWFQRQQTCPTCRLNILRTSITVPQPQQQQPQPQNNQVPVVDQQPPIIQPNPFLNLLNQTAPAAPLTSTSGNSAIPTNSITTMPPFPFFPSFLAPFSIPPPPIPANLEHLSTEELRAMEGNERNHVEERLKLLKNVNTMINASIAMMNQYQMIVSNLPPIPTPPIVQATAAMPSTSSGNEETKKEESPVSSSTNDTNIINNTSKVKIEDLGSEDHLDLQKSTSASSSLPSTTLYDEASSSSKTPSSSFLANEISSNANGGESEEANEIRKRRLQKFLH